MTRLSVIAAVARNGVIGAGGSIPWRLRADLARFKKLTLGHALIMGRRTFESIGRPLPGRQTIVLSRARAYAPAGVVVAHSIEEAMKSAGEFEEAFCAGGAAVYARMLPLAERLLVTWVCAAPTGDTRFPELDLTQWRRVHSERVPADEANEFASEFVEYERAGPLPASSPASPESR